MHRNFIFNVTLMKTYSNFLLATLNVSAVKQSSAHFLLEKIICIGTL